MDNEVIIFTSCLRTAVDFWERTNISQHSCQVLCTCTIAMIIFSVVMNDNYCQIPLPITFGYTTSPSEILCSIFKLCQICGKPQPCWQCVFEPQHNWCLESIQKQRHQVLSPAADVFWTLGYFCKVWHWNSRIFFRLICLCQAGQNINISTEPVHWYL